MSAEIWFTRLDPVHRTYNRVRWRYACHADAPQSGKDIALAAKNLPGVHDARANPGARSLIVEFDEKLTKAKLDTCHHATSRARFCQAHQNTTVSLDR